MSPHGRCASRSVTAESDDPGVNTPERFAAAHVNAVLSDLDEIATAQAGILPLAMIKSSLPFWPENADETERNVIRMLDVKLPEWQTRLKTAFCAAPETVASHLVDAVFSLWPAPQVK